MVNVAGGIKPLQFGVETARGRLIGVEGSRGMESGNSACSKGTPRSTLNMQIGVVSTFRLVLCGESCGEPIATVSQLGRNP